MLTSSRETADYFETTVKQLPTQAKLGANWIMGEINGQVNKDGIEINDCPISSAQLAALLTRISDGTISGKTAKTVFESMWNGELDKDADAVIAAKGLKQISDDTIEKLRMKMAANAQQVTDYRNGKEKPLIR